MLVAVSEYELGNFNTAIEILTRLVSAQPHNIELRTLLARALHRSGDQSAAWDAIAPVANREDADHYSIVLAGRILEALGERDAAAFRLDRAAYPAIVIPSALAETQALGSAAAEAAQPSDSRADPTFAFSNSDPAVLVHWWQRFGDPQLSALVEQALQANPSVRSAQAALQQVAGRGCITGT